MGWMLLEKIICGGRNPPPPPCLRLGLTTSSVSESLGKTEVLLVSLCLRSCETKHGIYLLLIDPAFLEDHLASIISYLSGHPLFCQARRNITKSDGDKAICVGCTRLLLICMYL